MKPKVQENKKMNGRQVKELCENETATRNEEMHGGGGGHKVVVN